MFCSNKTFGTKMCVNAKRGNEQAIKIYNNSVRQTRNGHL